MTRFTLGSLQFSVLPSFEQSFAVIVLCLAIVATAVLMYQILCGRARTSTWRRWSMAAVNVLAVVTLLLLLSDIRIPTSEPRTVVLVTPGTTAAMLDQVQQQHNLPDEHVYWLNGLQLADQQKHPNNGTSIHNIEQLAMLEQDLHSIKVLGQGLSQQQWQTLDDLSKHPLKVDYIPAAEPTGFSGMKWDSSVVLGEKVNISGTLSLPQTTTDNLAATIFTLILRDPSGQEVLRRRVKEGDGFNMNFVPPAVGRWRYQLLRLNHQDAAVEEQSVMVSVREGDEITMLIRQSAPSFETRALKDWLSQSLAKIRIETQISQNKWMAQNIHYNGLQGATSSMLDDQELLKSADLVVIDGRALSSLQSTQQDNLVEAVEQGLGVLILADKSKIGDDSAMQFLTDLALKGDPQTETKTTRLIFNGFTTEQPMSVFAASIEGSSYRPLIISMPGREPLLVAQNRGLGRIALSLISTTYQWPTQGDVKQFDRYWQYVIQNVARSQTQSSWLKNSTPAFSQITDTLTPCAIITSPDTTQQQARYIDPEGRSVALKLEPSVLDPMRHCALFKPAQPGWYQLQLGDTNNPQSVLDHFVYGANQWQSWQQHEKQRASLHRQSLNLRSTDPVDYRTLAKWPIWSVFILLCTVLWWEQKRLRQSR